MKFSGFLLQILSVTRGLDPSDATMVMIIGRPHAYLEDVLQQALSGNENFKIVVDRRHGERRAGRRPVAFERRRADRRRVTEPLAQVVVTEESSG